MQTVSTHAALVVSAPGQIGIERVPTPRPRSGEILIAPLYVGICGSDLDLLRGTRPLGARILGHEGVAEVVAVGPGTADFSVGQYVTFLPNNPNNPADILGVSTEGLYQQYLLIQQPALERGMVVPYEAGIPLVCGPLLEPFATVIYGQRLLEQVCTPERMVIVGAGPIGLLNALYARGQGCAQVFLIDTSAARLDWAVKRGIVADTEALLNSPQLVDILLERTAGQGVDVAYLCTPRSATRSALKQALRVVREDGGISLTAGTDSSEEFPELPGVDLDGIRRANVCGLGHEVKACVTRGGKKLWLTGHSGASASYLQQAMQLLLNDSANYARVISHLAAYDAAPRLFEHLLAADPQNIAGAPGVKVIMDFTHTGEEIEVYRD
ncbi:MAG TPA: alcohol dehydrogenase catalytic domain-containing protein [Ktedonobacterales bacterium]|jgi:threonine dehydrogenase-like Zn-dependent dehydrogenase